MESIASLVLSGFDESFVIYALGVLFGVGSILYFARDLLSSLSVTVKALTLYAVSVLTFGISVVLSSSIFTLILIIFCGFMYTATTVYVWKQYDLKKSGRFLLLAVSSILLLGVGRSLQVDLFADYNSLLIGGIAAVPLILSLVLSIIDLREETPITYEFEFQRQIADVCSQEQEIGTITVSNDSYFRREFNIPDLRVEVSDTDKGLRHDIGGDITNNGVWTLRSGERVSGSILVFLEPLEQKHGVDFSAGASIRVVEQENTFQISSSDKEILVEVDLHGFSEQ